MDTPTTTFLEQLVSTPAGREHLLSISVDAEEGDETGILDQLAVAVGPDLRSVVLRHRDDEVRHAALFQACLDRNGFTRQPLPDELKVVRQLAAAGPPTGSVETPADIVACCARLLALEERGVEQFPQMAGALQAVDPETAAVYRQVTRDERRHVGYCVRIGRRFAPSVGAWEAAADHARGIEARVFLDVGLANVAYCADRGWVAPGDS